MELLERLLQHSWHNLQFNLLDRLVFQVLGSILKYTRQPLGKSLI